MSELCEDSCHRVWNWQSVNHIPGVHDNGPRDHDRHLQAYTMDTFVHTLYHWIHVYTGCPSPPPPKQKKKEEEEEGNSRFFGTLPWPTIISFTLLDSASFPHYNNTKIVKFGWELFILGVISYGHFRDLPLICHYNHALELWKSGKSRKWQSIRNNS